MFMFFIDCSEEHEEDIYPMFDDDEYDDDYFDELYENDDWVLALGFEGIFRLYIIMEILFIR